MSAPRSDPPERLRARREASRRASRRRRYQLAGALAALLVLVVGVALANMIGSSGGSNPSATSSAASHAHAIGVAGGGIRSATAQTHPSTVHGTASTAAGTGRPGTEAVPILMYHVIAAPPAGAPFPGLYVVPSEFAAADGSARSTPAGTP